MWFKFKFLMLVPAAAIFSALFHEFGHCVFYWIQGIPAGMSFVKEYPLIDLTAYQYGIGSAGGSIFSVILVVLSFLIVKRCRKRSHTWNILSAIILANVCYFIMVGFLALLKGDGDELESVGNLIGLHYLFIIALFIFITLIILTLWIRRFEIRMTIRNGGYFLLLFVVYFASIIIVHSIDRNLFWQKFPAIQIDDGRIYNEHR